MHLKKFTKLISKALDEELSPEDLEERSDKYERVAREFSDLGAEDIVVESDGNYEPWIVAYYVIDNDLHDTYKHEDLIKDLFQLNRSLRFFDEASDLGDGILSLYLSLDCDASEDVINHIKAGMKQVPELIKKYYKEV